MSYVDALSELEVFEDGKPWYDLVFDVVEHRVVERGENGSAVSWLEGRALADMKGEIIGFGFEIPLAVWHVSLSHAPGDPKIHWSRINLVSIGSPTNKLVSSYATWFDLPAQAQPAAGRFECSAVALEDGPPDPLCRRTRFKLFFEACADEGSQTLEGEENLQDPAYAELFFNIDLSVKRAWLHEKDPEYRSPLLRFLTGELSAVLSVPLRRE